MNPIEQTDLNAEIKELKARIWELEKEYKYLYDFINENLEKVYTLSNKHMAYKEIYRQGKHLANEEIKLGWKEESWSIGYTFKRKLRED